MQLPTANEIENLHKKYAPSEATFSLVFSHSQIVWQIAEALILKNKLSIDNELVRAGCLLHDIGVYPLLTAAGAELDPSRYITHGILGEALLKKENFSETIWRFASHHTGSGITAAAIEREHLPLPFTDYLADTAEEQLVMYADKFHSKFRPCFNSFAWCQKSAAKYGEDSIARFEKLVEAFGVPDLEQLIKKYQHAVRD